MPANKAKASLRTFSHYENTEARLSAPHKNPKSERNEGGSKKRCKYFLPIK